MADSIISTGQYGAVGAMLDPALNAALVLSVVRGRAQMIHAMSVSVNGGDAPCRLLVIEGPAPKSVASVNQWDAINNLPAVSALALSLGNVLHESIVPANAVMGFTYGDVAGAGPTGGAAIGLTVILAPFAIAAAKPCYASLCVYGGDATTRDGQEGTDRSRSIAPSLFDTVR